LPDLSAIVQRLRTLTDAPLVLGGVGYAIFPRRILAATGADFGIHGDGELALVDLVRELRGRRRFDRVAGLVYRDGLALRANPPAWPDQPDTPTERDLADNAAYFRLGGQLGVETKRGCSRGCIYCVDPLAKGKRFRVRPPADVVDEVERLVGRGIDVLHLCDPEFNLPPAHAFEVCEALSARGLGDRLRWYAYLAVTPFPDGLAQHMRQAGCVGINFTSDAAHPRMLATYRHPHRREDLRRAVRRCRDHGMAVMLDMLLGGPGETPETLAETIHAFQEIGPDCAGAALGIRVYPNTPMAAIVAAEGLSEDNPNLRRHYDGPVDLLQPTFYIASALGPNPARMVRELIGGDPRFFPPEEETGAAEGTLGDHNYNANQQLAGSIAAGERGAYWDILRRMR
jgi:radical SAM superfamily enzyme YgiQ (UPF0313 family)